MYIGVDYYPEHWAPERWETDASLMAKAGFNVVRLAEFAWVKMEPEEGRFEFGWLDEALATLARHGISAILGTPTAAMPAWVARKYPETLLMKSDGTREVWGVRKQNCFSSGAYRLLSERISRAMAEHFVDTPNVIGWQTDNEFGSERCYCKSCRNSFQDWLRTRYGTLDEVNRAWGTHFWGHRVQTWGEITLPTSRESYNPGALLDWDRFVSWQNVSFQADQLHILRDACPKHFVTHNLMGFNCSLNYYDLAKDLDFVTWDNYPVWGAPSIRQWASAAGDLMRGMKRQNYWIMEQTAGPGGWGSMGRNPRPGEIRSVAFQQVAHGADGMVWFRWRTCTAGREQYWHGLLGHDGLPLRRYEEASQTAHELHALAPKLAGTTLKSDVAMIFDYEVVWALQNQPAFAGNDFVTDFMRYYSALFNAGVNVDIVHPSADYTPYKVIVAPQLYLLPDAVADALSAFVQAGGILVSDIRTGVKDATGLCHERTLPGRLSEALGIEIPEYEAVPDNVTYAITGTMLPGEFTATKFADWITTTSAETLAGYRPWHMQPYAAATRNRFGAGWGYYVGTVVQEEGFYNALFADVLEKAGCAPQLTLPNGIEMTVRSSQDGARYLFLLNHLEDPVEVNIPAGYRNLLTGEVIAETLTLDRFGVAVLEPK